MSSNNPGAESYASVMGSEIRRAEDVPASTRATYWRELLSDGVFPLQFDRFGGGNFCASIKADDLGAIALRAITSPAGACYTTRQMVKRSGGERFHVGVLRRGQAEVDHAGHQSIVRAGDFVIVNPSRVFWHSHARIDHVVLSFPRSMLPEASGWAASEAGHGFDGRHSANALFSTVARRLPEVVDGLGPLARARLGATLLDLLTVALADRLDVTNRRAADARRRTLLTRIQAFADERISDPDLSPGSIAAAHHISVRYLYRMFQAEGTTVSGWIRQRRLERTRRELLDPLLVERPVAAIAARSGFSSAALFSRVFRAAYGAPPGKYRAVLNAGVR
jgi:AraC-like DNA-binding protein